MDKIKHGRFRQTHGIQYPGKLGQTEEKAEESKDDKIVVMYFGAGRGPLIRRALAAAKKANANV